MRNFINKIKYKNWNSVLIATLVLIFIIGYAIFFLSPIYMSNSGDKKITALGEEQSFANEHAVTILNWEYSKEQRLMEIELGIENRAYDGKDTYSFSVLFRPTSSNQRKIQITKVVEETDYIVLQIANIPKNFKEISLRMSIENNPDTLRLYSNVDDIQYVNQINVLSPLEYHLRTMQRSISSYEEQIKNIEREISALDEKIINIKNANIQLEENKKYQITVEIIKTNRKIEENVTQIENLQKEIMSLKEKKREMENQKFQTAEKAKELKNAK